MVPDTASRTSGGRFEDRGRGHIGDFMSTDKNYFRDKSKMELQRPGFFFFRKDKSRLQFYFVSFAFKWIPFNKTFMLKLYKTVL